MTSTRTAPRVPAQRRRAAVDTPLGSLVQAGGVDAALVPGCVSCGADRVTRLAMTLTDGTATVFTSCGRCEHRAWEADGRALDITDVLARTRRPA